MFPVDVSGESLGVGYSNWTPSCGLFNFWSVTWASILTIFPFSKHRDDPYFMEVRWESLLEVRLPKMHIKSHLNGKFLPQCERCKVIEMHRKKVWEWKNTLCLTEHNPVLRFWNRCDCPKLSSFCSTIARWVQHLCVLSEVKHIPSPG